MNEQQKLLQSILSEAGIKLTENQTLAVIDAVSLSCKSPVPYHEVMEFKEKYAPCTSNKGLTIVDLHSIVSNASANLFEIKKDIKTNHNSLASHYNENNQPKR